jgi:hypothetical protein
MRVSPAQLSDLACQMRNNPADLWNVVMPNGKALRDCTLQDVKVIASAAADVVEDLAEACSYERTSESPAGHDAVFVTLALTQLAANEASAKGSARANELMAEAMRNRRKT